MQATYQKNAKNGGNPQNINAVARFPDQYYAPKRSNTKIWVMMRTISFFLGKRALCVKTSAKQGRVTFRFCDKPQFFDFLNKNLDQWVCPKKFFKFFKILSYE